MAMFGLLAKKQLARRVKVAQAFRHAMAAKKAQKRAAFLAAKAKAAANQSRTSRVRAAMLLAR